VTVISTDEVGAAAPATAAARPVSGPVSEPALEAGPRRHPLRLEREIWEGLETAAAAERIRLVDLRDMVDAARCGVPEARALRLFAIAYFHARARAQAAGHRPSPGPSRALTAALETVARGGL